MLAFTISNLGWDDFMRTTIDIDDQLLLYAKHQAVEQGCTIKQIMEDALRDFFSHQTLEHKAVSLTTFSGQGLKPGINLDNSQSLNDIMDGYWCFWWMLMSWYMHIEKMQLIIQLIANGMGLWMGDYWQGI